jgi:RecB family endonuclease NucS
VVIELKLSLRPDRALGQLLRYMGWVKAHLSPTRPVRGIIVASTLNEKLKYAVSMTNDIHLYEYELRFELSKPAPIKAIL